MWARAGATAVKHEICDLPNLGHTHRTCCTTDLCTHPASAPHVPCQALANFAFVFFYLLLSWEQLNKSGSADILYIFFVKFGYMGLRCIQVVLSVYIRRASYMKVEVKLLYSGFETWFAPPPVL